MTHYQGTPLALEPAFLEAGEQKWLRGRAHLRMRVRELCWALPVGGSNWQVSLRCFDVRIGSVSLFHTDQWPAFAMEGEGRWALGRPEYHVIDVGQEVSVLVDNPSGAPFNTRAVAFFGDVV
jgi:hypothetical protein